MAHRAVVAALLCCSAAAVAAQGDPCSGSVTLRSQEEVDRWNCTELAGTLGVRGKGVRSLRPLSMLTRIGRELVVAGTELRSLEGLHNVQSMGANIGTSDAEQEARLQIAANGRLESLVGLRALRGRLGGIVLLDNLRLKSLDGLENITEIEMFSAAGNPVLESLAALRVRGAVQEVVIVQNKALSTLQGLEGLWSIRELTVKNNEALSSLAALGNSTVTSSIAIVTNPRLRSLHGLEKVTTLVNLTVDGGANLESIDGLCNVRGQVDELYFSSLDKLTSLQCFADIERYGVQNMGIYPPMCFPEDARRKLLAREPERELGIVPPASWDGERCHNCAGPCGMNQGDFVACDYLSGTCRCPLGWYGPNCTAPVPAVSVVAGQVHHCFRPSNSWLEETCIVRLRIRRSGAPVAPGGPRALGVYDATGRSLYGAEQKQYGSLCNESGCVDVGLRGDVKVTWHNDEDGTIEMRLAVGYGGTSEPDMTVTLRVGYHAISYPDSLLEGTLTQPPLTPSPPLYPWCVDSGDCVQTSGVPVQLVVHGHGPVCAAGNVPNGTSCMGCPHGTVAEDGATSCSPCGMWKAPDQNHTVCLIRWEIFLACGLLCAVAGAAMLCAQVELTGWCSRWCLPFGGRPLPIEDVDPPPEAAFLPFGGRSLPIEDVALERDVVVLQTARPHGLRVSKRAAFSVTFEGTHHPDLDKPSAQIRARVVAHDKLELLDGAGVPLTTRLDTSTGVLRLSVRRALWSTWSFPVGVLGPTLLGVGVAVAVLGSSIAGHADGHDIGDRGLAVLISAGVAAASAARLVQAWRRSRVRTLLQRRLHEYLQKLPANSSQACDPGPNRGVRVEQLMRFHGHFQPFIKDRTMHYVVSNIIKPLTASSGLSFAELVGPSALSWFVSHYWGHGFGQLCQTVQKHAQATVVGRWEDQAYWICSFSNNQYKVKAELGLALRDSSFYKALDSQECKGTCLVLDERALPLTRSWCLFEVVQTINMEKDARPGFTGLLFCTHIGVMNFGQATVETSTALARCVTSINLQDAEASEATDKEKIDTLVVNEMGGFDAMNEAVRARLAGALRAAKAAALAEFQEVEAELVGACAGAASTPPAPRQEAGFAAGQPPIGAGTLLVSRSGGPHDGKLARPPAAGAETAPSQLPAEAAWSVEHS